MCGIVGVFDRQGAPVNPELVKGMRDTMRHRGPDDEGLWVGGRERNVVLGHRRLAIVDLTEAGRGPMANETGDVMVTFNGEIYNHAELRRRLIEQGHKFRSQCDTEVLVHLYEELGPAMVESLVGMFAFAIWDEREQRLFLARDRLGIKPLYWIDNGRQFAFASEIKALLPMLPRREIDPVALSQYLTFVAVPPPRTLFAGVSKLAPATTMVVGANGAEAPRRFWDPLENRARFEDLDSVDWESEFRFQLERSIDRRMMSDVPVGVFLSGGVDSSTNTALISQLISEPVNTFSVGFEGVDSYNEFDWARRIASQYSTNHHEVIVSARDLWDFLPQLVHYQDEPIADPVCVPLYFVAQLAKRNGVTVVHVGEGADETFAGYPTYVQAHETQGRYWDRFRRLPPPVRSILGHGAATALRTRPSREVHSEAFLRGAQRDSHLWWGGAVAFYERGLQRVTTDRLEKAIDGERPRDIVANIAKDADKAGAPDALSRLIYQDLRLRLPELLLMRVDKFTMANSVEARVPFLDHQLVEFAMSVPTDQKIRDGIGKHVVKRAVGDVLPQDLVWRPKQGFGTPVSEWFRGELAGQLQSTLQSSELADLGYIDPDRVQTLLDEHRSGQAERSFQLWNLLNLSTWFDHWIAREPTTA
jgi:asparagine synthase (glutamine-hydrolysing)